jgi:transcription termination factor Rho
MNDQPIESPVTTPVSAVGENAPDTSVAPAVLDSGGGAQPESVQPLVFLPSKTDGAHAPFPQEVSINDLQNATLTELLELAETVSFRLNASRTKHQLIYDLCSWMAEHKTRLKVEGVLEIGADNFGLIRYPKYSFAPLPEDVFVPLFLVRKFNLRPSQRITGFAKAPKDKDKYIAIDRITEVEGMPIEQWEPPVDFDKLTATFPNQAYHSRNRQALRCQFTHSGHHSTSRKRPARPHLRPAAFWQDDHSQGHRQIHRSQPQGDHLDRPAAR